MIPVRLLCVTLVGLAACVSGGLAAETEHRSVGHWLLVLEEQADGRALSRSLEREGVGVEDRHRRVLDELKSVADLTQAPLLPELERMQERGWIDSYTPFHLVNMIAVSGRPETSERLARLPGVARVQEDLPVVRIEPPEGDRRARDALDELDEGISPGLVQIRANRVWDLGFTGNNVLVANLDSGVDGDHPALAGRWRGDLGHPYEECWFDLATPITPTPDGYDRHGTMTMGIMCGMEPGDTVGVAWGANYIAASMIFGLNLISDAITVFEWFADPDGDPGTIDDVPRVISNSWGIINGSDLCSDAFAVAIDNCEALGAAVIWAAGNEGPGLGSIRNPANLATSPTNTFSVGGHDQITGDVWSGSSRGPTPCSTDPELMIKPEVLAPARNIRSANLGGGYHIGTGTSYAVPHVGGVLALMTEANPNLSVDSLKSLLMITAVDGGDPGEDIEYGWGVIDAYTAVFAAWTGGVCWVEGQVSDEFGAGVQSEIYLPDHPHVFPTDNEGYFRFVMPGWMPFEICVIVPSYEIYSTVLAGSPGDTIVHDITLVVSENGTLTGTLYDCEGLPGVGGLIEILDTPIPSQTADANGRFQFSLPEGFYNVRGSTPLCGETIVYDVQVVTGGITDIEIVLPTNPTFVCSDPDGFGYTLCDHHDPGGPIFHWRELVPAEGGSGIILNMLDDESQGIVLPFPVNFYGIDYDVLWVNANGTVSFGGDLSDYSNQPLPLLANPAVFAFWDDLNDEEDGLEGHILAHYNPAAGEFVVEWSGVPRFRPSGVDQGKVSLEIVLYDMAVHPTISGTTCIDIMYGDMDETTECTVGIDAADTLNFLPYVYDGQYEVHASPLVNGLALRVASGGLVGDPGAITVERAMLEMVLDPGESVDTSMIIHNTGSGPLAYSVEGFGEAYAAGAATTASPPVSPPRAPVAVGKKTDPGPAKGEFVRRSQPMRTLDDAGGIDEYGYAWIDSREPGGPEYSWFDISSVGFDHQLTGDDTLTSVITLPWSFPFYGESFRRVVAASNGFLSFWSVYEGFRNFRLDADPLTDPFYMVAPFWIDLDMRWGGYVYSYYDSTEDRFFIQWDDIYHFSEFTGTSTFQAILYPDGAIEFVYEAMDSDRLRNTTGIKGGRPGEHRQLAYWNEWVESNLLVRIHRPDTAAASCTVLSNAFGVVSPGGSISVPLRVTNNTQGGGASGWEYVIRSSDPFGPALDMDVYLIAPGPIEANLVAARAGTDVMLHWKRYPAANYCVYSGGPNDAELTHFEGVTSDTFFVITDPPSGLWTYEIRLCTAAAGEPDSTGGP